LGSRGGAAREVVDRRLREPEIVGVVVLMADPALPSIRIAGRFERPLSGVQEVVKCGVLADYEVLGAVIILLPVDMVHDRAGRVRLPDRLLGDEDVLEDIAVRVRTRMLR